MRPDRAALMMVLALAALAPGRPARAQEPRPQEDPAAVAEARERFAKGVQLYREGSLEASLAEFEKAAQLAPSYRLQYNIAQVQYELHNYVGAMRAYRRYLAYGGEQITSERRAKVQNELSQLEARVAQLTIKTNVPGATVAIDEVRSGTAPLPRPVLVNPGLRRISAMKTGYQVATVTVNAAGGEQIDVALELPPITPPSVAGPAATLRFMADTPPPPRPRIKTWLSVLTTGVLAAGAGSFALLTREAHTNFERQLARIPNTKDSIESARKRMVTYAAVTDGLAVSSLVAGAVALYVGLTEGNTPPTRERAAPPRRGPQVTLGATSSGVQAVGRF
jgi:tetratricopeptide (TPR) repeat protein